MDFGTANTEGGNLPQPFDFDVSDPVQSFVEASRRLITPPVPFFTGTPRRAGYGRPTLYAMVGALVMSQTSRQQWPSPSGCRGPTNKRVARTSPIYAASGGTLPPARCAPTAETAHA